MLTAPISFLPKTMPLFSWQPMLQISVLLLVAFFTIAGTAAAESRDITVVQAIEIIAKIESGEPVNYNAVTIAGDLNLSKSYLPNGRVIKSPISITNSIFTGSVDLSYLIMQESANFKGTRFMGPARFIGAEFKDEAVFESTLFDENSFFIDSEFNNSARFHYAKFNGSSNFLGVRFKGKEDFHNSQFYKFVIFMSAIFEMDADFQDVIFVGRANFRDTIFSNADFSGTTFKESGDFNLAKFNKSVDFTSARFAKELYFNDVKFEKFLVSWDSIGNALVCNGPTYLLLIKNFKEMQQFEDADNCYYQYRDEKRRTGPFDLSKLIDYISWLSCGYGVRWQHPILSAILIAVLFGIYYESYNLVNVAANRFHRQEVNDIYKYDFIHNFKKSLSFSTMMLLSLPSEWSRFGREEYAKFVVRHWFAGIVERLIGWGLMLLLVGVLTRLMIRY
jgi:uncharacterized protein YjbI with pentapeptide repeats